MEPIKPAAELWQEFIGDDNFGPLGELWFTGMPKAQYARIPLSELSVKNPKGHSIAGCWLWYPADKLAALQQIEITVLAPSEGCSFYFLRIPVGLKLILKGGGHKLLSFSAGKLRASVVLMTTGPDDPLGGCKVVFGERGFMAGVRMLLLNTDMIIKRGTLWSDEILVQGANQHGIVDLQSGKLIDFGRSRIVVNEHAWIGRRAVLMPRAEIGKGAILATAAVATKRYPPCRVIVGNPGVAKGPLRTWADKLHGISDREHAFIAARRAELVVATPSFGKRLGRRLWHRLRRLLGRHRPPGAAR